MSKKGASKTEKPRAVRRILFVVLALILAAAAFAGGWFGRYYSIDGRMRSLMWALDTLKKNYYEDLDEDALYDDLFAALQVDPYTRFYTKAAYSKIQSESEGNNSDTGISVIEEDNVPVVYSVVGNSTASLAGLKKGMYICAFGATAETAVKGNKAALIDFVAHHKGSFVLSCGYEKNGADAKFYTVESTAYLGAYCIYRDSGGAYAYRGEDELTLTDITNTAEGVPALEGADGRTAYLRIDQFDGRVAQEFVRLLAFMKERGRDRLVLDLRGNGGGYLNYMASIASHLMKDAPLKRAVVATAKYRDGGEEKFAVSMTDYSEYFGANSRIKVLADRDTASASECLIGAMVEYGTVGYGDIYLRENEKGEARTFGKGIMQSHFTDITGNVMKVTVATVHWPVTGKCIHGVGVTKEDGAVGVVADELFLETNDPMLSAALSALSS